MSINSITEQWTGTFKDSPGGTLETGSMLFGLLRLKRAFLAILNTINKKSIDFVHFLAYTILSSVSNELKTMSNCERVGKWLSTGKST